MQQQQQLTQFYLNENLLPSEKMGIKFWRELNENEIERRQKSQQADKYENEKHIQTSSMPYSIRKTFFVSIYLWPFNFPF